MLLNCSIRFKQICIDITDLYLLTYLICLRFQVYMCNCKRIYHRASITSIVIAYKKKKIRARLNYVERLSGFEILIFDSSLLSLYNTTQKQKLFKQRIFNLGTQLSHKRTEKRTLNKTFLIFFSRKEPLLTFSALCVTFYFPFLRPIMEKLGISNFQIVLSRFINSDNKQRYRMV